MPRKNVILSENEMDEKVHEFREWIKTQPDLPQNIETRLLLRYLKTYGFKLDRAQSLLKLSFEFRAKNKYIFAKRDFLSPEIQQVLEQIEYIPMLKATPENYKCCIHRVVNSRTDSINFIGIIKTFFMVADVRLISEDPNDDLSEGEVPIFDMKNVTLWHLFKINFAALRLYFKYTQECHPIRAQQIHVYNCTPLINRIMSLIKPLLKPEVAARFQFHTPGSDTIFQFIPREMLPDEYGGTAGPISTFKDFWMKKFLAKRDYVNNDSNWIVDKKEDVNNNEADCE